MLHYIYSELWAIGLNKQDISEAVRASHGAEISDADKKRKPIYEKDIRRNLFEIKLLNIRDSNTNKIVQTKRRAANPLPTQRRRL